MAYIQHSDCWFCGFESRPWYAPLAELWHMHMVKARVFTGSNPVWGIKCRIDVTGKRVRLKSGILRVQIPHPVLWSWQNRLNAADCDSAKEKSFTVGSNPTGHLWNTNFDLPQ